MPKGSNDWDIYIGNIPHQLTKEHIVGLFKKYNIVEAGEVHINGTKTFCFMKLQGEDDAANAVTEMNGHNVNGRKLIVRRFEYKQRNSKQENNGDTKSNSSSSTFEDIPPLLETQFKSESNSDLSSHKKPKAQHSNDKFQASGCSHQHSSNSHQTSIASPYPSGYNYCNKIHDNSSMSPQVKNSSFNDSHNQSNITSDFSPVKENTLPSPSHQHSQISPQVRNAELRPSDQRKQPSSPNISLTQEFDRTSPSSAVHDDQSSQEVPEKYCYVHCTRNVMSYNPRDLENNKMRFKSSEHSSSEAVKVWAANFPFGTTKVQMLKLFEDFSPLKVYINNNSPGQDFTRATIILPSLDAAETAIMELDNTIYKRRTLLVGLLEEDDEFAYDYYDDEEYDDDDDDDDADYHYYEPHSHYREEGYYHRPQSDERSYYEEPVSRRFHNIRLS